MMTSNAVRIPRTVPQSASGAIALDKIESLIVRQGLDHWVRMRGVRQYPARSDFSPRALTMLLRNIVLLRTVDNGADYEFRVVGDAHVTAHGFSMQGLRVSDVDKYSPGYGRVLKSLYDHTIAIRDAFAFRGWMERGQTSTQYIYSESVFLPLGLDDQTIDHILNFSVYSAREKYEP